MSHHRTIGAALLGALVLGAPMLAACGKQGALDRPGPLFDRNARAERSAQRANERAQRAAAAQAAGQANRDSSATSQTNGDYTQSSDGAKDPNLRPFRSAPPPGAPNDPFGSRSGGVIPDPFADPNRAPR